MERITRHNYEAFFLDFIEGNLSEAQENGLKQFLKENPDLANELEDFESVSIKPSSDERNWQSLKVPAIEELVQSETLRDKLYFRCAEAEANERDQQILAELLKTDQFQKEYESWQRLRLTSTEELMDRGKLYQLPLILPVNAENYPDFLVARTEGILSDKENSALEKYAAALKNGSKDLAFADAMRLEAPRGVFYPNKDELKKKRKGLALFYRAAAVILLFGIGATLFTLLDQDESHEPRYAERQESVISSDTLDLDESEEESKQDSTESKINSETYQLQEWEIREPDPVYVAEEVKPDLKEEIPEEQNPLTEDVETELQFAELEQEEIDFEIEVEDVINLEVAESNEPVLAEAIPTKKPEYQTLGEVAENRLANELNLSDMERDELALTIAKRITQKAGETLDSEVSREVNEESETLTYTLRIGGFKVSHTTAK
jgi:hypothetical protein